MNYNEDLDFEITFYENLLKKKPDFVNALIALGDAYTRKGRYEDGLKIDQRLTRLKPDDPLIYYNLACSYSLLKETQLCLEALTRAISMGYSDFVFMERDPDLEFIRKDPRYRELLEKTRRPTEEGVSDF